MSKTLQSLKVKFVPPSPRRRIRFTKVVRALSRLGYGRAKKKRVDILFTDDRQISTLAGKFRASPRATDVLAFVYGDDDLAGEVVISVDTAMRQARERGVSLTNELILLCVHGLLHIGGQGDETYEDRCAMRIKEFESLMRIL